MVHCVAIDRNAQCVDIAREVFQQVSLSVVLRSSIQVEPSPELALTLDFEVQPGLLFPVSANLQNVDELHLSVGTGFWCEWFPCDDPAVTNAFRQAIEGVLSGDYRVIEFYRKNRSFTAKLQRTENGAWRTVATSTSIRFPSLTKARTSILQNTRPGA
jgi:hypothetical protein